MIATFSNIQVDISLTEDSLKKKQTQTKKDLDSCISIPN